MESKKKFYLFSVLVAIAVVMVATGVSYAYFTASISGSANSEVVTAGTMSITYSEGSSVNLLNALPGDSVTKTFSIENTGSLATSYTVYLSEVLNEFVDKTDLAYTLVSNDANVNISSTQVPSDSSAIVENKSIGVGETHHYTLTITFLNKNEDQNDNQEANFSAKLSVNEYSNYSSSITKLVPGNVFNEKLKTLAGTEVDPELVEYCNQNAEECSEALAGLSLLNFSGNDSITSIEVTNTAPQAGTITDVISTNDSAEEILAWFDNGTIYIYSDQDEIYFNEDVSLSFIGFGGITSLNLSSFNTSYVTNMNRMFYNFSSSIELDLGNNFDTSNVTDMSYMFYDSKILSLDLGDNFDTSSVTNMEYMFAELSNLTNLDVGDNFDTSNVLNMSHMFYDSIALTSIDFGSKFYTTNVTNMEYMFAELTHITSLDLGNNFNTSNVTNMSHMFFSSYYLQSINLGSNFDTSNVTNMEYMFAQLANFIDLDLGDNFDTSSVINMDHMFYNNLKLRTITLGSKFYTTNVTNMDYMFSKNQVLRTIYTTMNFDVYKNGFNINNNMFDGDYYLAGGNDTNNYRNINIDASYALIDCSCNTGSQAGYFTYIGTSEEASSYCTQVLSE